MSIKEKIALMQANKQATPMLRVSQETDGQWRNQYEYNARFERSADAEMAARWCEEWGCK